MHLRAHVLGKIVVVGSVVLQAAMAGTAVAEPSGLTDT
jgi:hypothetical protein